MINKPMFRLFLILLSFFSFFNTFSQTVDKDKWKNDINLYKTNLEDYHIDLYARISKPQFEKELQQILSTLDKKNRGNVIIDLMRLTRKIGDGHTAISLKGIETHLFPIEIYKVEGKWRVIKTTQKYKDLLGKVLTKIEGEEIEKISKEVAKVAQYVENEQSEVIRTGRYLMLSEILYGLQFTKEVQKATFTFVDDTSGKEVTVQLDAIKDKDYYGDLQFESFKVATPEIQKPKNSKHDYLWYSLIKDTKGVYIKFESYPSFEDMEKFGASVLDFIKKENLRKVVIDLSNYGGGDFFVGTFLAYYLNLADSIDWKSGVYVLTDKVTFSAATSNAAQFRQMLNAKIIGEPTGSNPTGYQDMGQFSLPNLGIVVTYSKRLFRFQENATQGVQPDVVIPYDWNSYSKGIDNMLEWVIADIKRNTAH